MASEYGFVAHLAMNGSPKGIGLSQNQLTANVDMSSLTVTQKDQEVDMVDYTPVSHSYIPYVAAHLDPIPPGPAKSTYLSAEEIDRMG
jgi:hypothetical protein